MDHRGLENLTLLPYRREASFCWQSHGTFYVLPVKRQYHNKIKNTEITLKLFI